MKEHSIVQASVHRRAEAAKVWAPWHRMLSLSDFKRWEILSGHYRGLNKDPERAFLISTPQFCKRIHSLNSSDTEPNWISNSIDKCRINRSEHF